MKYMRGDLVRLVARKLDADDIVLGAMTYDTEADLLVPAGTLCMVQGVLDDEDITSEAAYIVMLETRGKLQDFWVYESEMALVSRP